MHFSKIILTTLAMSVSSAFGAPTFEGEASIIKRQATLPPGIAKAQSDAAALKASAQAAAGQIASITAPVSAAVFLTITYQVQNQIDAFVSDVKALPALLLADFAISPATMQKNAVDAITSTVASLNDAAAAIKAGLDQCNAHYQSVANDLTAAYKAQGLAQVNTALAAIKALVVVTPDPITQALANGAVCTNCATGPATVVVSTLVQPKIDAFKSVVNAWTGY